MSVIAILGAGSWGATLAKLFAEADTNEAHKAGNGKNAINKNATNKQVRLFSHSKQKAEYLKQNRTIERPCRAILPDSILVSSDLAETVEGADIVIACCTSQNMRSLSQDLRSVLPAPKINKEGLPLPVVLSAAKGIELGSFKLMSQVLQEHLPGFACGALSGPNLAVEILEGKPTASVVACRDEQAARFVQAGLNTPTLRMYMNTDVCGVEMGGALKNVIAIAAGGVEGLKLGVNARAALMTRGLAEMSRMALTQGGDPRTLAGLSGLGDLITTCSSPASRNFQVGLKLVQGKSVDEIREELGVATEGIETTYAVCTWAETLGVAMPIAEQVNAALKGKTSARGAIMALMSRPLASE